MGFTDWTHLIPLICGDLLSPIVFVVSLWILQKYFPKARTLYLCSIGSFIVISGAGVVNWLNNFSFRNELIFEVVIKILRPGFVLAALFVRPLHAFDDPNLLFVVLAMVFSEIFYTVVFLGVVMIISYSRKKLL
jgi:hypothetical protein